MRKRPWLWSKVSYIINTNRNFFVYFTSHCIFKRLSRLNEPCYHTAPVIRPCCIMCKQQFSFTFNSNDYCRWYGRIKHTPAFTAYSPVIIPAGSDITSAVWAYFHVPEPLRELQCTPNGRKHFIAVNVPQLTKPDKLLIMKKHKTIIDISPWCKILPVRRQIITWIYYLKTRMWFYVFRIKIVNSILNEYFIFHEHYHASYSPFAL